MGITKQGWEKRKLNGKGVPWNKGKSGLPKHSQEHREKIRIAGLGNTHGFKKGHIPFNKGKPHLRGKILSLEHRKKLSISKIGKNNPAWCGGISKTQPYNIDWTQTLKRSVREIDRYTCRICGKQQENITFHIHHIDYDKENCNPNNLITLCPNCHSKTNNKRSFWKEFLQSTVA